MKKTKSSFRDKIGHNILKQRESRKGYGYLTLPKDISMLSLEDGTKSVKLDIIPYIVTDEHHLDRDDQNDVATPGSLWFRRPIKVHREVGANNETVICPTIIGKKCPICEFRVKRIKEGADKEEFKLLYPKERSVYVVIPIDLEKTKEVPYLWDMSDYLFQEELNTALDEDEENRMFPDLEEGKTLDIRLKWKAIGDNSYPEVKDIKFLDREPYDEKIVDEIPKLDEIMKILTYAEIESKFLEMEEEEDAGELEDTDEEVPVRSRRKIEEEEEEKPRSFRRKKVEEEADDIHTRTIAARKPSSLAKHDKPEPKEEEEEEDETPQKPSRKAPMANVPTRRKPVEEPEEEEEPPVITRTRKEAPRANGKCPYGHIFGADFEKFKDCDSCDKYDDCFDESKKA